MLGYIPIPHVTRQDVPDLANIISSPITGYISAKKDYQEILKQQLANKLTQQYGAQQAQADIKSKLAQALSFQGSAAQSQAEAAKTRFLIEHPNYINPQGTIVGRLLSKGAFANNNAPQTSQNEGTQPDQNYSTNNQPSSQQNNISPLAPGTPSTTNPYAPGTPFDKYATGSAQLVQNEYDNGTKSSEDLTTQQQIGANQYHHAKAKSNLKEMDASHITTAKDLNNEHYADDNQISYDYAAPAINYGDELTQALAVKAGFPQQTIKQAATQEQLKSVFDTNLGLATDMVKSASGKVDANSDLLTNINIADKAYDNILGAKGGYLGYFPAFGDPNVRDFDNSIGYIVGNQAQILRNGTNTTNADVKFVQGTKLDRTSPEETKNRFINVYKGAALRDQEWREVANYIKNRHINPELGYEAYLQYVKHRPIVNQHENEYFLNNAYANSWRDYFTREALNAIAQGNDYTPSNQKELEGENISVKEISHLAKGARKPIGEIMRMIESGWSSVPTNLVPHLSKNMVIELNRQMLHSEHVYGY